MSRRRKKRSRRARFSKSIFILGPWIQLMLYASRDLSVARCNEDEVCRTLVKKKLKFTSQCRECRSNIEPVTGKREKAFEILLHMHVDQADNLSREQPF